MSINKPKINIKNMKFKFVFKILVLKRNMYQIMFLLSISHINMEIYKVHNPDYLYFKLKSAK